MGLAQARPNYGDAKHHGASLRQSNDSNYHATMITNVNLSCFRTLINYGDAKHHGASLRQSNDSNYHATMITNVNLSCFRTLIN